MLLHHRNWPVLPPNGRAQGQPGAGVDPLSDGTGVAPTHVPTLPPATSAFSLTTLCPLPACLRTYLSFIPRFGPPLGLGARSAGPLLRQPPVSVLEEFDQEDQTDSQPGNRISSNFGGQVNPASL